MRDKYDSITVTKLVFDGARNVSPDDLKRLLFTRASTCRLPFLTPVCGFSASQLYTDRRRTTEAALGEDITKMRVYLWQRGFRQATVDTVLTPTSRGSDVTFRIVEGEPTRVSTIDVVQTQPVLSAAELADVMELKAGDPFSLIALDSSLAHLQSALWNKGYADARIDTIVPPPDASRSVPVRIVIEPRWISRVGSVSFEGNDYLDAGTLRRGLVLQPGSLYTRDAVLESQRRLFQSPAIARAIVITPAAGDSVKALTVAISETKPHHVALTAGFNTIDFGQASLTLRHNDLGAGRWLSIHASVGNLLGEQLEGRGIFQRTAADGAPDTPGEFLRPTYQATLTLTQPWLGSARTSASVSAFAGRRSLPNIVIDDDAGVTLGLVHELGPRIPLGINYRVESTRVQGSAVYFCAGYGVCDTATRTALTRRQLLAPIGISAWIDRSDDLEVPTEGYTALLDAEHASGATASDYAHNRIAVDGSYYRSIGERKVVMAIEQLPKVLALHGRAGYVRSSGVLHPRMRFYAGGMQSVRGFAENELGPEVLQARRTSLIAAGCTDATITSGQCDPSGVPSNELFPRPVGGSRLVEGSAELRVPLMKMLGAVVFLDGAYVGADDRTANAHSRFALTPGGGFRYRSPLGVLRLDFGLRPVGSRDLPVVVALADDTVIQLAREKRFSPIDPSPGWVRSIGRRIVVHFAMGQAF